MTARPTETTELHTRLLKCTLEVESSRAWWQRPEVGSDEDLARRAFEESWFGVRSLPRIKVLVANLRARFDAFPHALRVLRRWPHMDPHTRGLICHWHVQLTDPLYRAFTGSLLVRRHEAGRSQVTRDFVTRWVDEQAPGRWTAATRIQFASQLLVTARAAGLVRTVKDPRELVFPRVSDMALTYLLYLLRGVDFKGSLLDNPYLAGVGLGPGVLDDRLPALSALQFRRQGDLVDFGWVYQDLEGWAQATIASEPGGQA